MRAAARRVLRTALAVLAWTLVSALALAASIAVHLRLPLTLRVAGQLIHEVVSDEIRGELQIGTLERVSAREVIARDVVLIDGEGRRVIEAERLVLVPDLPGTSLAAKRVHIAAARLDGARVYLYDSGDGLPSMITAFDAANPGPPGQGQPLVVAVDGIAVRRITLIGELLGLRGLRADVAEAGGSMQISRQVHVRIDGAHGTILEPFGFSAPLESLSGTISTVPHEGIDLRARARRGAERADARVRYATPEGASEGVFSLQVQGEQLTTPTLRAIGLDYIPELDPRVSGTLDLHGPFSHLVIAAELASDAGPVRVEGNVTEAGAVVRVSSPSMQVQKLRAGVPALTVAGVLRIETKPAPPDAPPPETRLHLELEPLVYAGFAVPGFSLDGALTETGVRIDGAEANARGARMQVKGNVASSGAFDLQVRAKFPDISRDANLAKLMPDAHGRLDADVHVENAEPEAKRRALRFEGRISLGALQYGPLQAAQLVLQGSARGDPEHPALRLDLRGKQVSVSGYALGDPSLRVRGGPREYQAEGQFVAAGKRNFNASAKITAEPGGAFVVEADPVEFAVGDGSWRGAVHRLRIVPDQIVELEMLRLASRSQRLEAHGVVRTRGADQIEAQLQDFDLAALHALLGGRLLLHQGRADAHFTLKGDLERPEILIQGALREGAVMDIERVNALYFITYGSGAINADGEIDLGERGLMQLSGHGSVDPGIRDPLEALRYGSYELEVSTQALSIALLPAIAAAGVSGNVSGSVRAQGTLERPELRGAIELEQLSVPGWSPLQLSAQGGYDSGLLSLALAAGDERGPLASAEGQMQLDWPELQRDPTAFARVLMRGPWQLTGESIPRRLDQLPSPLGEQLPFPLQVGTTFVLRKQDGHTSGNLGWNGTWAGTLRETTCAQDVQVRLRGSLVLERDTTRFELAALHGVSRVASWSGTVDTPVDTWVAHGQIERPRLFRSSARVNIDAIQRLPYLCEYGNGSVHAELELDGGLSAEPMLVGALEAKLYPRMVRQDRRKPVRVRSCEGDPIRARLQLDADRDNMRVRGGTDGCHGGPIAVSGVVPVIWTEWLVLPTACPDREVGVSARFDGAQLKPLVDRIPGVKNSDALANGQVDIRGIYPELRASGALHVTGGRLYLVPTGQELTDIDALLDLRGNWAKLEHLSARQEQGTLEASGGIGFTGLRPERVRVALRTDKLPLRREGIDMGVITASAGVDAEIKADKTHAVIKLNELKLRLPDASNRTLQALEPHPDVRVVTEAEAPRTIAYPIELVVEGRRKLNVQRKDFSTDVGMELALGYRDPNLNVGGRIEFLGGEFEAFGQRFEINSGALRFNGGTELNPDVYLIATQKPEGSAASPVVVSVTGTLAEPVVTFSSDVCPGDVGAITYLVSGRCTADDTDLAQESDDARAAVRSGIVSGVLTLGVQSQLPSALPRIAIDESGGVRAGFSSQALVPKFMRGLVQRVYVQGGVGQSQESLDAASNGTAANNNESLDFLIELYFPHSIVGAGRFAQDSWGLDVTWEP